MNTLYSEPRYQVKIGVSYVVVVAYCLFVACVLDVCDGDLRALLPQIDLYVTTHQQLPMLFSEALKILIARRKKQSHIYYSRRYYFVFSVEEFHWRSNLATYAVACNFQREIMEANINIERATGRYTAKLPWEKEPTETTSATKARGRTVSKDCISIFDFVDTKGSGEVSGSLASRRQRRMTELDAAYYTYFGVEYMLQVSYSLQIEEEETYSVIY